MNSGWVIKILGEGREFGMRGGLCKVRMNDMMLAINESNMDSPVHRTWGHNLPKYLETLCFDCPWGCKSISSTYMGPKVQN